ncbi:hypothetical protein B7R22_16740 [Subtercola boreus]|uniref:HTH lacI-type domain-containing protein n=1 Tax=Subtercola boreus TaxID=120213 RepID=A0A3E0VQ24_9MICO|nr:LacI family DNA-binding transcriptional regulator [Subtercola boreus]RFA12082.1 hypothetical protein B7R22_16740 [Subtercola boreus]
MPASMHDVAQLAGVSQRTVSNVVNEYVHVKPETRARVQKAIKQLKYRPNVAARNLRSGRSGLIALAVPEIAAPYFAELADQIQQHAELHGMTLLIDQTGGTRERELAVLHGYSSAVIDGLILSPVALTAADLETHDQTIPTLLLGERIDPGPFLHLSVDNVAAARTAVEFLISSGRTNIAALGVLPESNGLGPASRRLQGYTEAMQGAGLTTSQLQLPTAEWGRRAGYAAIRDALDRGTEIDAVFCFNDLLAIGAIRALTDRGISIPARVALIGWDDIEESRFTVPTLSTICPDKAFIARTAVERLIARIAGNGPEEDEIIPEFQLIHRQTTQSN